MAVAWRPRWRPLLSMAILVAVAGSVVAKNVAQMSVTDIEDAIQVGICPLDTRNSEAATGYELQKLTVQRDAH